MLFQQASQAAPYLNLVPLVVFLPVIGMLVNWLFGKWLGEKGVGVVASLATGLAFVVAVLLAVGLAANPEPSTLKLLDWITVGTLNASWAMRVDTLSVTMMLVVAGVGTLIHIYAIGYMHQDVHHNGDPARFRRFFIYLNLFIASMMILVSADNYLMLFVGWEGVGLCSYLLIGFWFEKGADSTANMGAAKKAFVVNRIGDFGLLIALFLMFWNFGTFQFDAVFAKAPQMAQGVILAITLFMLLGVAGKSAQIPLYVWLPDAMAGPTPVSALIHAATMVTAGVYLVTRSHALYAVAPAAQAAVMWVGTLTALLGGLIAVGQYDIKRVLAYSTISQLGFMVAAVGMGAYTAGMFHLITHAFFKALLFLSAGSVILGMERGQEAAYGAHGDGAGHGDFDPQDMRNMGGLRAKMPVTFWVYLVGALALAGVAPLSGFFSKDEILAAASQSNGLVLVILILAAFLTAFYMGRQIFMIFFGPARTRAAGAANENGSVITLPLIILAILAAFGGALNLPGVGTLAAWLEHTLGTVHEAAFMPILALSAFLISILGIFAAWLMYGRHPLRSQAPDPLTTSLGTVFSALTNKLGIDQAYNVVFLGGYRAVSKFLAGWFDQGLIDGIVNGLGSLSQSVSQQLRQVETGFVRSYALMMVLGIVLILSYLVFWPIH